MKIIQQDIAKLTGPCVIAHGVNTQGVMGAGVALAIKNRWPTVYEQYRDELEHHQVGDIQSINLPGDIVVLNLFTQDRITGQQPRASYDGLRLALMRAMIFSIDWWAANLQDASLHLPYIGCGLGGLEVSKVIKCMDRIEVPRFRFIVCTL